jgi:hypothetical protein
MQICLSLSMLAEVSTYCWADVSETIKYLPAILVVSESVSFGML